MKKGEALPMVEVVGESRGGGEVEVVEYVVNRMSRDTFVELMEMMG